MYSAELTAEIDRQLAACLPLSVKLGEKLAEVVTVRPVLVLHRPQETCLWACGGPAVESWELATVKTAAETASGLETRLASRHFWSANSSHVKLAESNWLRGLGEKLNFLPGHYGPIPNAPSPLAAALTGGVLGGGLGYGAGWLGEKLFPQNWQRGRLRRSLAALGAGAGMALPAAWGLANVQREGLKGLVSPEPFNTPPADEMENPYPKMEFDEEGRLKTGALNPIERQLIEKLGWDEFEQVPYHHRSENLAVDVDEFNRAIFSDGDVSNRLNPQIQQAASGALYAASQLPGGSPGWVTPSQMAQLTAAMGAGYASGALVGAGLGALTGAPPETQEMLRRTGMYAALVQALVPKLFGR